MIDLYGTLLLVRNYLTLFLIKVAMKTCVSGDTFDSLEEAYLTEDL